MDMVLLLLACAGSADDSAAPPLPEPLDLPADPAENGVPVGVRTIEDRGQTLEVWYPAADAAAGSPTEQVDFSVFVPTSVTDVIGPVAFPLLVSGAVRDAPLRVPEAPYPVVVFSHGFGGTRLQSLDYTVHLASRGYVVVAADHPGRTMGDLLPCLFEPALDGCDLSGMTSDPAISDVEDVLDWLADASSSGTFAGALDVDHIAMTGHSAGGGTTESMADDPRFTAFLPMAAGARPETDAPVLLMGGTCDAFATDGSMVEAWEAVPSASLVRILDAGHLAFSDLCELNLLGLAEDTLVGREDVNQFLLEQLIALASDGCAEATPEPSLEGCSGTYLPLTTSDPIVRHYATVFLDAALRGEGGGVTAGVFPEADVPG